MCARSLYLLVRANAALIIGRIEKGEDEWRK
jgi:hypothetical protein